MNCSEAGNYSTGRSSHMTFCKPAASVPEYAESTGSRAIHGICATGRSARLAGYAPHFGEEQPLVGTHGSGTIFFASCNLRCCFCQNYDISHFPENYPEISGGGTCRSHAPITAERMP